MSDAEVTSPSQVANGLLWSIFALSSVATAFAIAVLVLRAQSGSQASKFVGKQSAPLAGVILAVSFAVWILSLAGGIEAAKQVEAEEYHKLQ